MWRLFCKEWCNAQLMLSLSSTWTAVWVSVGGCIHLTSCGKAVLGGWLALWSVVAQAGAITFPLHIRNPSMCSKMLHLHTNHTSNASHRAALTWCYGYLQRARHALNLLPPPPNFLPPPSQELLLQMPPKIATNPALLNFLQQTPSDMEDEMFDKKVQRNSVPGIWATCTVLIGAEQRPACILSSWILLCVYVSCFIVQPFLSDNYIM